MIKQQNVMLLTKVDCAISCLSLTIIQEQQTRDLDKRSFTRNTK